MSSPENTHFPSASFVRRLASWVYDLLTAVAISMVAAVVYLIAVNLLQGAGVIDMSAYEDPAAYLHGSNVFRAYLLICLTGFFGYFWVRGGQTIGMRAWRLRVLDQQGKTISWVQAIVRFYASLAGLGNLWVLFDFKNRQSLQDHLAKTRTVVLSKEENRRVYREL